MFGGAVAEAREVNGAEEPVGPATLSGGALVTKFGPFQPRTFAVKLAAAPTKAPAVVSQAVALPYNHPVTSPDRSVSGGAFDGTGRSLPAEMLPADVAFGGVRFRLGPTAGVTPNAVIPRGQTIALPSGSFTRLYLLAAAATDTDQRATFKIGDAPVDLTIQSWSGYVGQWDNRIWKSREEPVPLRQGQPAPPPGTPPRMRVVQDFSGLVPGFVKRAPVAWFASHRHGPDGANEPYAYSYLFAYSVDIPAGAKTITLPVNERIRVMAITVSNEGQTVTPARPLYDTLTRPPRPPVMTNDR
jgi:alpha-mannosidase